MLSTPLPNEPSRILGRRQLRHLANGQIQRLQQRIVAVGDLANRVRAEQAGSLLGAAS